MYLLAYLNVPEFAEVEVPLLLEPLDGEPGVHQLLGELLQLRRQLRRHAPRVRRRARLGAPVQPRL